MKTSPYLQKRLRSLDEAVDALRWQGLANGDVPGAPSEESGQGDKPPDTAADTDVPQASSRQPG